MNQISLLCVTVILCIKNGINYALYITYNTNLFGKSPEFSFSIHKPLFPYYKKVDNEVSKTRHDVRQIQALCYLTTLIQQDTWNLYYLTGNNHPGPELKVCRFTNKIKTHNL